MADEDTRRMRGVAEPKASPAASSKESGYPADATPPLSFTAPRPRYVSTSTTGGASV